MDELATMLARVGIVGAALTGGALYGFSTFIMAALKRLPNEQGIRAMQQINKTVFTPWFMVPFFGTALLSLGAVVIALLNTDRAWWVGLGSAGAFYALGVFAVTAIGNVPLNNRLDAMDAENPEAAEFWQIYVKVWTRWNHIRSLATVLCLVMFGSALLSM